MRILPLLVLLLCGAFRAAHGQASNITFSVSDKILKTLFEGYQKDRPAGIPPRNETTMVQVNMKILAITSVDVRKMEYTMDLYLRQEWVDLRLAWGSHPELSKLNFNGLLVSTTIREKAWLPDLFFRNGKAGRVHQMTKQNSMTRCDKEGRLLWSEKITMRFSCEMHLQTFPMDTQQCHINIGSYGYESKQLKFEWRENNPVQWEPNLSISEFTAPKTFETFDCTSGSKTSTGSYSCLNVTFVLSRELGSWLTSTYIPSILIVIVSWLSFWVSLEAVPARVTLGLLALIGTLTQASLVTNALPRVSYIKAIDVWTIVCIAFDIAVLIEFAVASNLAKKKKDQSWKLEVRDAVREELTRWCTACQQQHHLKGPSATGAYYNSGSVDYFTCANNAALALKRGQLELCEQMEQLISSYESTKPRKAHLKQSWVPGGQGFERLVNESSNLLPPEAPTKPSPAVAAAVPRKTSEIDEYSRFLFPACFILYNSFYWVYYLVLQPQVSTGG